MSTELLAAKVVILEEEPKVPAITALPSAVLLCLGLAERGPIADRNLFTSFDEFEQMHGGFTAWADAPVAVHGFFYNGGSFLWFSRTTHFTDLTNPSSYTATTGQRMLRTAGTGSAPGSVRCTVPGAWDMRTHGGPAVNTLDVAVDGAPPVSVTMAGTRAMVADTTVYPIAPLVPGVTLLVRVDGGAPFAVAFAGGETLASQIADAINAQVLGGHAEVNLGGQVEVYSDTYGTNSKIQISGGTAMPPLVFAGGVVSGTGNVASMAAVTAAEVEAAVEGALPGLVAATVETDQTLTVATVATGPTHNIQIAASSLADTLMGFDNVVHAGSSLLPEDTLLVAGKTPGSYAGNVTTNVAAASSGVVSQFNFQVLKDGLVRETFPNVTMDRTLPNHVEAVVNHPTSGSDLIAVTDQLLPYSPTLKRPANGLSAALAGGGDGLGGLGDSDFIGNEAGPTGLFCFDLIDGGTILVVPGQTSAGVQTAMLDYAETHRGGTMFCVLDPPAGYTAVQMVAWLAASGLEERSEFGAVYWPRIKIVNPSKAVYGSGEYITVPPSGWVAGLYAKNDQKIGGIYESPAGTGGGFGVIRGMVGVEDDPNGNAYHEVLDEKKRDLIYPHRINPICKLSGTPWHIDGGRTLKSTGNFPNIGERRGVIFISASVKTGLIVLKHRYNNADNRRKANRIITAFLLREMAKDAFRSKDPKLAFYVDSSDQLNPVANEFAGIMTIRLGLATNKPDEFIVVIVTQDTRALLESLGV